MAWRSPITIYYLLSKGAISVQVRGGLLPTQSQYRIYGLYFKA